MTIYSEISNGGGVLSGLATSAKFIPLRYSAKGWIELDGSGFVYQSRFGLGDAFYEARLAKKGKFEKHIVKKVLVTVNSWGEPVVKYKDMLNGLFLEEENLVGAEEALSLHVAQRASEVETAPSSGKTSLTIGGSAFVYQAKFKEGDEFYEARLAKLSIFEKHIVKKVIPTMHQDEIIVKYQDMLNDVFMDEENLVTLAEALDLAEEQNSIAVQGPSYWTEKYRPRLMKPRIR